MKLTPCPSGFRFSCLLALVVALVAPLAAAIKSAPGDWAMVDEIIKTIQLPKIPQRDFLITAYGAKSDGSDALPAIKAAIKAASEAGGGRVVIPKGNWLSNGPIHLVSKINLHVAEGATLLFGASAKFYLPVVLTRWEGTELYSYSPLIYAFEVQDVAITGNGVIDGNGQSEFLTWQGAKQKPDMDKLRAMGNDGKTPAKQRIFGEGSYLRPPLIQFFRAERVLLEDYTLKNSAFWVNHLVYTDHATVRGIKVDSHHTNNDGIDVDSGRYVLIENCWFRTGDDSVVVKSGRDRDGRDIARPSEYVVIRNNDMGGEDGIALGSEMSGDVRHVFFTDNILRKGVSAIRFKANFDRGGTVEHIRVRNMTVESFDNFIWFQLDYPGLLGGGHPSTYRDIVFENLVVERVGTVFEGTAPKEAPLKGVVLRNIQIKSADKHFVLKNVEGLKLENVTVAGKALTVPADSK